MKYRLAEQVSLTDVDDQAVLLDLDSGTYFGINHVGAYFLRLMESDYNSQQAIQEIARHYDVDTKNVETDINELIEQLIAQKLILIK